MRRLQEGLEYRSRQRTEIEALEAVAFEQRRETALQLYVCRFADCQHAAWLQDAIHLCQRASQIAGWYFGKQEAGGDASERVVGKAGIFGHALREAHAGIVM